MEGRQLPSWTTGCHGVRTSLPYFTAVPVPGAPWRWRLGIASDSGTETDPLSLVSWAAYIFPRKDFTRRIAALLRHQTVDSAKLSHAESYDAPTATATVATVAVTGRWSRGGPPPSGEHAQPVGRGWAECAGKGARHLPYQDNVSPEHTHTQQRPYGYRFSVWFTTSIHS